jgi:hypothetical protein
MCSLADSTCKSMFEVFAWVTSMLMLNILITLLHDNFEPLESACRPASYHHWACTLIRKRKGRWMNEQMKYLCNDPTVEIRTWGGMHVC